MPVRRRGRKFCAEKMAVLVANLFAAGREESIEVRTQALKLDRYPLAALVSCSNAAVVRSRATLASLALLDPFD